jgi:predicted TIM-barrel fold metal-dependent hydrolase
VKSDGGAGTDFYSTPNGYPHTYAEFASLLPTNHIYHLSSLIAEGVFERIPDLRFVFADGGHDVLLPLMWRMDMDWPISRIETPWVTRLPSDYLGEHVRFVTSRLEGPTDPGIAQDWFDQSRGSEMLMFASRYPDWNGCSPSQWGLDLSEDSRRRVFIDNAVAFYGLSEPATPAGRNG